MLATGYSSLAFSNNCIDFGIYSAAHIAKLSSSELPNDPQHTALVEQKEDQT